MVTSVLDTVYRREWPRILAAVIRYTGSLELAEDAVQEAFLRAAASKDRELLVNPAAWVTTVAKRIAIDALRRDRQLAVTLPRLAAEPPREPPEPSPGDDDRLGLLFMVCSPALSAETRLALALRFVCGVPTDQIANAMLISRATLSARLTRAKKHIERNGIRFTLPQNRDEFTRRLTDVLNTIYLLYTIGHTTFGANTLTSPANTTTALELARAVQRVTPGETESAGLLALLLLTEARSEGRLDPAGFVLTLQDADRTLWDQAMIAEGLQLASVALAGGGRLALEAGISGLHSQASHWSQTDWQSICVLYDGLVRVWSTPAAHLARIAARSYLPGGERAALAELDALSPAAPIAIQTQAVAVRADILRRMQRTQEARAAYLIARSTESNEKVREFFTQRIRQLDQPR